MLYTCYINREENAPERRGGIPLGTTVWPDLFYSQFWDRSHNWVRQPLQIQPSWPVTTLSGQIYVYIIPEFWTHSHGLLGTRKLSRELSQTELSSPQRSIIMRLNMYRERDQHTCQPLAYYNVITNSSYRVYWCSYWSLEHLETKLAIKTARSVLTVWTRSFGYTCRQQNSWLPETQLPSTPSLPQPVVFPGWKLSAQTRLLKVYFGGSVTNLISILCVSIKKSLHILMRKIKQKGLRIQISPLLLGRSQVASWQWKG